jgi:hypothetical protein
VYDIARHQLVETDLSLLADDLAGEPSQKGVAQAEPPTRRRAKIDLE